MGNCLVVLGRVLWRSGARREAGWLAGGGRWVIRVNQLGNLERHGPTWSPCPPVRTTRGGAGALTTAASALAAALGPGRPGLRLGSRPPRPRPRPEPPTGPAPLRPPPHQGRAPSPAAAARPSPGV